MKQEPIGTVTSNGKNRQLVYTRELEQRSSRVTTSPSYYVWGSIGQKGGGHEGELALSIAVPLHTNGSQKTDSRKR